MKAKKKARPASVGLFHACRWHRNCEPEYTSPLMPSASKPPGTVPLVRALSKLGLASRTQTAEWIAAGRLAVNGRVCRDANLPVAPERDRFALDGKPLSQHA